ncbi:hypothetical protein BKG82_22290 [Mycobacteroides chelonae]|uniref:Uncharacterized protein n=1 Tax=Mycobacteroides chelonae TaxID=1774 RepID=A0A1S1LJP8_MYCCH|nr:hypothetical protein AOT91_20550 [Mycobacteroides sp. H092]KRQ45329.1 hypothetical protein AOT88_20595 [Mycobacteroides sp. H063]KRQ76012.1 hypothetical protein AOT89_01815 [Mycobacteroides sp. H070]KRQ83112.1 hypothetical protein AOT95_05635 [Mycobacteroides sp. HXXIII]OHT70926.1 hypothetical protein BKG66_15755 [Mycobacteroides chelonae]
MTKCVVSQFKNGHTLSQPTSTSQTTPIAIITTFFAVGCQSVLSTIAATKAATPVDRISTRAGPISRFQCGWRCNTTCSSSASTFSGYPTCSDFTGRRAGADA